MNPFAAKNQPKREYQAPDAAAANYNGRKIAIQFYPSEYWIVRGPKMTQEIVEEGPICPEVSSDDNSREARKVRKAWINELIERVRQIAIDEKLAFSAGQGFSSLAYADYR